MAKVLFPSAAMVWTCAFASPALAFDFGRARVPDYLDGFIFFALVTTVMFWIAVMVAKPRGMPIRDVFQNPTSALVRIYVSLYSVSLIVLLGLFFSGMYLIRVDEAELRADARSGSQSGTQALIQTNSTKKRFVAAPDQPASANINALISSRYSTN